MHTLEEMRARSAEIEAEMRQMHEEAGDAALADDAAERWEALDAERRDLAARIADAERRQTIIDNFRAGHTLTGDDGSAPAATVPQNPYAFDDGETRTADLRGRALSAIEETTHADDDARQAATDLLERRDTRSGALARHVVATGRPEYRSAWSKIVSGQPHLLDDAERRAVAEARAMSLGTDSAGGYAVPWIIDPTVVSTVDTTINPMRGVARVESIVTDTWRGITRGAASARWAAEASEASDNSFTIDRPEIPVHKADAFVPFSVEIEGDWPALEAEAREAIAEQRDELEAAAFIAGDGSGKPEGLLTGLGAAQTIDTGGAFSADSVYALRAALPSRYRGQAAFGADLGVYQAIRQFDTAGGADLWVQIGGGEPNTLVGHPAVEFGAMEGDPTTNDAVILAFGYWRRYLIVDRVGMTIELVPHLVGANGRPTGERGFYAYWRVGGKVLVPDAFRALKKTI